ncbi:MAG: hypothetical protein JO354_03575 [Verrucomicrobia bacterium]|nr:hypothetical protein [Verrucomicrobiota bacterium]
MKLILVLALIMAIFIPAKLELESYLSRGDAPLKLGVRERIGQSAYVAVLGGFRSVIADLLFIDASAAWERTDWTQLLLRLRQATELQPHSIMFWDVAAWHMAWNASIAAERDETRAPSARLRASREYIQLGRDFLERGVAHNPDQPQLYEALARLYRDRLHDHARAAENFYKASQLPGHMAYDERFSAYELSWCKDHEHEREAYERLRALYLRGENERLPTLISRLKFLEQKLNIRPAERLIR